jgi:hypothetical protein
MPTTLDPATALILVDLQHGITARPTVDPSDRIVARGARLADAFRAHKKLVVATRVAFAPDGGDVIKTRTAAHGVDATPARGYGEFRSELKLAQGDIPITKRGWNAFYGTELDLEVIFPQIAGLATTEEVLAALELLEPRRLPPGSATSSQLPSRRCRLPPARGDVSSLDPALRSR